MRERIAPRAAKSNPVKCKSCDGKGKITDINVIIVQRRAELATGHSAFPSVLFLVASRMASG